MIRLFVGLGLPELLVQRLALLRSGVPGARWMEPDTYHVTLRFIGEVAEDQADLIHEELSQVGAPAFAMEIAGFDSFGSRHQAQTLFARVEKCDALLHLHDKIETAIQRCGLPAETRRYAPHVTLARLKESHRGRLEGYLREHSLFHSGPIAVDRFRLYRSHLGRNGAHYSVEAEYPLTPT